ncbi:MAG: hypothetical protein K0U66_04300 [Gammaproteobacteria bacterium]|nr:hypothetical protein [Gammaproteobacteria bacterium]
MKFTIASLALLIAIVATCATAPAHELPDHKQWSFCDGNRVGDWCNVAHVYERDEFGAIITAECSDQTRRDPLNVIYVSCKGAK